MDDTVFRYINRSLALRVEDGLNELKINPEKEAEGGSRLDDYSIVEICVTKSRRQVNASVVVMFNLGSSYFPL